MKHDDAALEEPVPPPLLDPEPEEAPDTGLVYPSRFATCQKEKKKRAQFVGRVGFHDLAYKAPCLSNFADSCKIRPNESSA